MENLEASIQQGVASSPTIIGALCNVDLLTIEGCATTPLSEAVVSLPLYSTIAK